MNRATTHQAVVMIAKTTTTMVASLQDLPTSSGT